jgi:hypothetical protein
MFTRTRADLSRSTEDNMSAVAPEASTPMVAVVSESCWPYLSRLTHLPPLRRKISPPSARFLTASLGLRSRSTSKLANSRVFSSMSVRLPVAMFTSHRSNHSGTRSLRPTATEPGFFHDSPITSALAPSYGVMSRVVPVVTSVA